MKVTVRLAEEKDTEQFVAWEYATENNGFGSGIVKYPSLRTLVSEIDGEPALYMPFHPVIVVESLGHRPGISTRQNAIAIFRADQVVEEVARKYSMAEVWWLCSDPTLIKAAQARGYEVLINKPNLIAEEREEIISRALELGVALTLRKKVTPNA